MKEIDVYNVYSKYLQDRYGEKVYKLPISLPLTCPNRDGRVAYGGCIFCGEEGGSFENLPEDLGIKTQINMNKDYIGRRYKAKKYIAYFQSYTNTYLPLGDFKRCILEAIEEDIVGIAISTRPDCINDNYLSFLQDIQETYNVDITVELGLQSINPISLKKINRGHSLGEYIDACIRLKKYNLRNCTHMILNLPWDEMDHIIEGAKIISALGVEEIKLHSLYIVKNTKLEKLYENGEIKLISRDEYIERVIEFLEYLSPDVVIQRLLGRAPEDEVVFENWGESWWKIRDIIVDNMVKDNKKQGNKFDYLNGKAIKSFL